MFVIIILALFVTTYQMVRFKNSVSAGSARQNVPDNVDKDSAKIVPVSEKIAQILSGSGGGILHALYQVESPASHFGRFMLHRIHSTHRTGQQKGKVVRLPDPGRSAPCHCNDSCYASLALMTAILKCHRQQ